MIGYVVLAFFLYFLYRFIVGFVLPVVRTANQMKRKVNEMKQPFEQQQRREKTAQVRMEVNGNQKGPFSRFSARKTASQGHAAKPSKSDYIDFEEVK